MKKALFLIVIGLLAAGGAWVLGNRYAGSAATSHDPGDGMASIDLGKGKVMINYGTPKLGARNLDEMIKPGVAWFIGMNPDLDDRAPALMLAEEPQEVLLAARNFLANG